MSQGGPGPAVPSTLGCMCFRHWGAVRSCAAVAPGTPGWHSRGLRRTVDSQHSPCVHHGGRTIGWCSWSSFRLKTISVSSSGVRKGNQRQSWHLFQCLPPLEGGSNSSSRGFAYWVGPVQSKPHVTGACSSLLSTRYNLDIGQVLFYTLK